MRSLCETSATFALRAEKNCYIKDPNKAPFPKRIEDTSYGYQQNRGLDHTGKCLKQKYIQFSHVLKIFFLSLLINIVEREGFNQKYHVLFLY